MSSSTRFHFLDSLRGFAIVGILLVNAADIMNLGMNAPIYPHRAVPLAENVLNYLVATRFVPIFIFMFGMSMGFVIDSAIRRGTPAWKVLLRRLATLLVIGTLNSILYPGEVLRSYAIGGIILIPFILKLSRSARLFLGLLATVGAYAMTGGGEAAIPGVFLLGSAAQAYGFPARLEHADRRIGAAALVFAASSAVAIPWQATQIGDPRFSTPGGIAGGLMACLYVSLLALLWRTSARRVLSTVFEPLGRMALTCYVTATFIMAPAGLLLHSRSTRDIVPGLVMSAAVLAIQWVFCRFWLSRFIYGPLEWVWRSITWWRRIPLQRQQSQQPDNRSGPYRYAQLQTTGVM